MQTATKKADGVPRKKRDIPARVVKLDGDLVTRAKQLGQDCGLDTGAYLSRLIRPVLEKEWVKFQRRIMEQET